MSVSANLSNEKKIIVRFDVVGWTCDENDAKEAELNEAFTYVSSAVSAAISSLDVAEDLLDFKGLFEKVEVNQHNEATRSSSPSLRSLLAVATSSATCVTATTRSSTCRFNQRTSLNYS